MANELLEASKIFYTPYEPKLKNRFIMEIGGIPAFMIKTAQRPQITFDEVVLEHMNITKYVKGKRSLADSTDYLIRPNRTFSFFCCY